MLPYFIRFATHIVLIIVNLMESSRYCPELVHGNSYHLFSRTFTQNHTSLLISMPVLTLKARTALGKVPFFLISLF